MFSRGDIPETAMSDGRHEMLDAGRWMLDAGCSPVRKRRATRPNYAEMRHIPPPPPTSQNIKPSRLVSGRPACLPVFRPRKKGRELADMRITPRGSKRPAAGCRLAQLGTQGLM
ncbi:uncharacterized protein UV8b_07050 [Ustilaginoidea virens]|uniref:Uncharacterized protein n=1 Tax=Ustilaginoidea virens TaxID=1159556 RepID=A0A8E5HWD3_USTVR|nr:uncharacterized protein UV8b_07050 [Ustilaginoidea virens]QUC22809.1 hypothetical protein UV8b_07050 [Ustilaginoidea virens]